MPQAKNLICALDIGTSKIAVLAGEKKDTGEIEISGIGLSESTGVRKGQVTDIEETISSISAALEQAERMSGMPLDKTIVSVGGVHITSANSKGVIAVSRADGEISEEDIHRVIEAAKAVSLPANREIIHVVPRVFTVDGQEGVKDPIGMTGIRLEVDSHVISGSSPAIKNLSKCVYQAGLEVSDLVFSGLAESAAFLTKQQKEIGTALIDIGAATTTLSVYEEGNILHSKVMPVGSDHITNDIAIGLRTSIEVAEKIKLKHGEAVPGEIKESEEIDLSKLDPSEKQKASKVYIAEIIEARLQEIFNLISDELKGIGRDGTLPGGAIFTGGGSKMPGICEAAKEALRLPANIAKPQVQLTGMVDNLDESLYACSIGLMTWGAGLSDQKGNRGGSDISRAGSKIKGFLKHFLP